MELHLVIQAEAAVRSCY